MHSATVRLVVRATAGNLRKSEGELERWLVWELQQGNDRIHDNWTGRQSIWMRPLSRGTTKCTYIAE